MVVEKDGTVNSLTIPETEYGNVSLLLFRAQIFILANFPNSKIKSLEYFSESGEQIMLSNGQKDWPDLFPNYGNLSLKFNIANKNSQSSEEVQEGIIVTDVLFVCCLGVD
jgi:hypothetical protein